MSLSSMELKKSVDKSFWRYIVISALAYVAIDINLQGFLALLPFVREDFVLSGGEIGFYASFFFLSSTLMAIFGGQVVDSLGSRKGMVIGVLFVGSLMAVHSIVPVYAFLLALALLTGIGFSLITPSVNKAVMEWSPASARGLAMGIMQSGGCIGGLLGAASLPFIAQKFGWRVAILIAGLTAIGMAFLLLVFYREKPRINKQAKTFELAVIKELLANRFLLMVCLLGLVFGSVYSSVLTHLALFFNQDLGFTKALAGLSLGILQIGGITGRLGWSWIGRKVFHGSYRKVLFVICMINVLMSLVFSIIHVFTVPIIVLLGFTFILGTTAVGWLAPFYTILGELADQRYTGTATGLSLIFIRAGVVISPPLFGYLADLHGAYQFSWLLLGLVVFVLAVIFNKVTLHFE